jgi:hypothetical protein
MRLASLVSLSLCVLACERGTSSLPEKPVAVSSAASPSSNQPQKFGDAITMTVRQDLKQVLSAPETYAGKTVLVEGHVRKACSRKGCWMELAESADAKAPGCRVTFKDYGFFVPTDSAGSEARVQAAVELSTIKARQVEHLEQEGASFKNKQEDGSAQEVRLVASGVELRRL